MVHIIEIQIKTFFKIQIKNLLSSKNKALEKIYENVWPTTKMSFTYMKRKSSGKKNENRQTKNDNFWMIFVLFLKIFFSDEF